MLGHLVTLSPCHLVIFSRGKPMPRRNRRTLLALAVLLLGVVWPARAEPPRSDLYGDPLPEGARARMGTIRFRQGGSLTNVAIAPDGKTLATAGSENSVPIWDAATGKIVQQLGWHPGTFLMV